MRNTTLKLDDVRKLVEEEFHRINEEDWVKRCQHVMKVEEDYKSREYLIDIITESNEIIINLEDSSDEGGEDSTSDGSDSDDSD